MKLRLLLGICLLAPAAWAWVEAKRKLDKGGQTVPPLTEQYEAEEWELFI